jgi:excisionase family DNA binding protein
MTSMAPKTYTTGQAAKAVGITRATLQAWIAKGKLKVPSTEVVNGHAVRLWSESDVSRLRQAKREIYRKEMGRPPKSKK